MTKLDLRKTEKHLYRPSAKDCAFVDVPGMNFLMVDGQGDPNTSQSYTEALEALFGLAYALKFMIKKGPEAVDYAVMPLEGLWWAEDMNAFSAGARDDWLWTMMIRQPDVVTADHVSAAREKVAAKKNPPALPLVRFEHFDEGAAAQVMHVGPFTEEGPTIERLHTFIEDDGRTRSGKHHEIYLSDIRRAAPEKWRTVIRQPCR